MMRLSSEALTEEYEWHYHAFDEGDSTEDEIRAFRENPNELLETTIAGHDAMMIQNLYTGKDQNSSNERLVTANIRGYGIPHGEGYTVVMFVQEKEPDDARLDALAEMFAPVSE